MQKRWNRARMKSEESYFHLENEKFRSIRESVETATLRFKKNGSNYYRSIARKLPR